MKVGHTPVLLLLLLAGNAAAMDVRQYDLWVEVLPDSQTILGEAVLTIDMEEDDLPGPLDLHLVGLTVTEVELDGQPADFERPEGLLRITLPGDAALPWKATVRVVYQGGPEEYLEPWGSWGVVFEEERVYTVNVTEGARYWFPCHDVLDDKAPVDIHVTVPAPWQVAAPGDLEDQETIDADRTRFHWHAGWPITPYLIHFAAGMYTIHQEHIDQLPYRYWLHPTDWETAQPTLAHAPEALAMLEERYGPYPFPKVGFAEINLGGAVENPSCVSLGTQIFSAAQDFADVIAHELAHSWFQGVVTVKTWDDLWLSEGMATWHEALYHARQHGPDAYLEYMKSLALGYRAMAQAGEGYFPMYAPEVLFGGTVYRKGAAVLHMLRELIGEETFDQGLLNYLHDFEWESADTQDFRAVMEEASGQDLEAFFEEWVHGTGYPELGLAWRTPEPGLLEIYVEQLQPENWTVITSTPLGISAMAEGHNALELTVPLEGRITQVTLPVPFDPDKVEPTDNPLLLKTVTEVDFPPDPPEPQPEPAPEPAPDTLAPLDTVETIASADTVKAEPEVVEEVPATGGGEGSCAVQASPSSSMLLLLLCLLLTALRAPLPRT